MNDNIIKILITAKDEASSVLASVKNNAAEAADASKKFAVGLAAVGAAAAGFVGYGAKIAGDLEASRAGFITLLGSAGAADDALAMIKKDAASTPFELPGLITANQLLTSVTKNAGTSEALLMNVGKALTAMGKGQPELDRIIVNLQQIGAVGKASLMDVRQFAFAGIPIFEMLQQTTGKTGDALNDFISQGGVTFDLLTQMFDKAGGAGGRFENAFKNQAGGFNQILSNLKDNVGIAMADIVTKSGAFDVIKGAMQGVSDWIQSNKDGIINGIKQMFEFIGQNAPVIAGIIIGGLIPAFASLAVSIWATLAPLLPFMAAGALLAVGVNKWAESIGGWGEVMQRVQPFITTLKDGIGSLGASFKSGEAGGQGFVGFMSSVGAAVRSVVDVVVQYLVPIWKGEFMAVLGGLAAAWGVLQKGIEFLKPSFEALWNTISQNLLPTLLRLWNFISPVLIPALQIVGAIIGGVIVAAVWLLVNAFNVVFTVVSFVINAVISIIQGVANVIMFIVNLISVVLTTAFNIAAAIIMPIINAIVTVFTVGFNIISGAINVFMAIFSYVFAVIMGIATVVWQAIWGAISPVIDAIGSAIGVVGGVIGGIFNSVKDTIISVFRTVWNFISPIINGISTAFGNVINNVVGFFSGLWGSISGFVTTAVNNVKNFFSGMFSGIGDGFKTAVNWIIDGINGFIGTLNDTVGKLPGVPHINKLNRLYTGGEVTSGGMAIVGEHGAEAVMLPAGAQVVSNRNTQAMLANGGGGGGANVNINVEYNGRGQFTQEDAVSMAKQIRDALRAQGLDMTQIGALRT